MAIHGWLDRYLYNRPVIKGKTNCRKLRLENKGMCHDYLDKYLGIDRSLTKLPVFDFWNNELKAVFSIASHPTVCF